MAVYLRAFRETDYAELTALYNRCRPEVPETEASIRAFDRAFKEEELLNIVAADGASLVGAAWAHPHQTGEGQVLVDILAANGEQELADRLYEVALEHLRATTTSVLVRVRENWVEWLEFYAARGFREYERMWESRLTLATFAPETFSGAVERVTSAGIDIKTLADLPDTEMTQRRLYDVIVELLGDVPFEGTLNIWPFEVWQRRFWAHPSRRPESFFLALDRDEIVGVSELRAGARSDWLYTGLTGVKRNYRRRGIALALKLSALQYARDSGFAVISTQNHMDNRLMLSINEALNFIKEPAWIKLEKAL